MNLRTAMLATAGVLAATVNAYAFEATTLADYSGEEIFLRYCAACHGDMGRGNGPVARSLKIPAPDLTAISRHYGGFPTALVRGVIDGRGSGIDAHGTRTMPVWGYEFWIEQGGDDAAKRQMQDVITKLVDYIRSIQDASIAANRN
jgi:mono/diheme cytochrome c family protein